jgi:hypothetical protein
MTGQCTSATVRLAKTASRPVGGKAKVCLALFSAAAGEWESRWACTRKWTPGHGESGELELGSGRIGR